MRRLLPLVLLISFILWILPLGVFIKPSEQKLACDGQRAICMCHIMVPKPVDKAMEAGMAVKAGSATAKENASGGAGNYFVSTKPAVVLDLSFISFFEHQQLCYQNPFRASFEPVPKI